MEMLLCYEDEGVYVNTYGRITKDVVLQWGEMPTSVAYIHSNQIMGWGEKAIEIRSVETGHLDGVFMHKRAQRLKFLCERNDKVGGLEITRGLALLICCWGMITVECHLNIKHILLGFDLLVVKALRALLHHIRGYTHVQIRQQIMSQTFVGEERYRDTSGRKTLTGRQ
ncbi:Traf2 and NCK-interacting protein kinase [Liparis tanakae]|uniref:non-specific serine/threonine protein kinase n=1 Tax=Liparis tanakae TaxID=230148 RepID=A0A4Z2E7G4_9TELE|nr:Traf2 and NCK-interacting protein kinase [Liparis tanakae]